MVAMKKLLALGGSISSVAALAFLTMSLPHAALYLYGSIGQAAVDATTFFLTVLNLLVVIVTFFTPPPIAVLALIA
jgi:hypothetical protein